MKKINIGVLGTIGVGKTTLLHHLADNLKLEVNPASVVVKPEPSVVIPFINEVLTKFYKDNGAWSYPLQLCISAAQEAFFQELRESDYEYALMDMPYSSDIYSYSYAKRNKLSLEMHYDLENIGSHFPFDYIILINEDKDTTIKRIMSRNNQVKTGSLNNGQSDVSIDSFDYLNDHITDFHEYENVWLTRFKTDNPNIKIIILDGIPDLKDKKYDELIDNLTKRIINDK